MLTRIMYGRARRLVALAITLVVSDRHRVGFPQCCGGGWIDLLLTRLVIALSIRADLRAHHPGRLQYSI
jgi:hypothetical protein